jgi:hypothetical protein
MNRDRFASSALVALALFVCTLGCASPYRSDQGALAGGLGGAGLGAIVGHAVGNTGAGALIGAGVGTVTGAAIGGSLDQIEARNRAEIAAHLGRPAPTGVVSVGDVVSMTKAGVPEDAIVTHIQNHGVAAPLQSADLIALQQQGVSPRVMQAMQAPAPAGAAYGPNPYAVPPPYWGPGYPYPYPPPYAYPYYYRPYPRVGWGVTIRG